MTYCWFVGKHISIDPIGFEIGGAVRVQMRQILPLQLGNFLCPKMATAKAVTALSFKNLGEFRSKISISDGSGEVIKKPQAMRK